MAQLALKFTATTGWLILLSPSLLNVADFVHITTKLCFYKHYLFAGHERNLKSVFLSSRFITCLSKLSFICMWNLIPPFFSPSTLKPFITIFSIFISLAMLYSIAWHTYGNWKCKFWDRQKHFRCQSLSAWKMIYFRNVELINAPRKGWILSCICFAFIFVC